MIGIDPLKTFIWQLIDLLLQLRNVKVIIGLLVKLENQYVLYELFERFGANFEKFFHVLNLEALLNELFKLVVATLELFVQVRPW